MKTVYIFRGAPASGKGTLAAEFVTLLPKPVALIEQDDFRWGFHLAGRIISEITDEEHRFAYDNMTLIYEAYLKNGNYTIILEGLFSWDDTRSSQGCAKELIELAHQRGYAVKSFVLQADKDVLIERNRGRPYVVPDDEFNDLYNTVYRGMGSDEISIDSSHQTVRETLEALKHYV